MYFYIFSNENFIWFLSWMEQSVAIHITHIHTFREIHKPEDSFDLEN